MGIAKLNVEAEVGWEAKFTDEADERSRSSADRLPSMLLLSETDSDEFLDLPDIPPMGRLLLAMFFTS